VTSNVAKVNGRAAVLGTPIAHSLSPVLHGAAYRALGLSGWTYDLIECDEDGFPEFVANLGPEWAGLSLTMPLKRIALTVADEVSPLATAVGAANTMLFDGGKRRVENTDVVGIVHALREAGVSSVGSAIILGAGGTAQAALAALRELGQSAPTVIVRNPARTEDLKAAAVRLAVEPQVLGGLHDGPLPAADVIISTLPAGAADALGFKDAGGAITILDVVYVPWPTPFAARATEKGARIVSGLSVLLHQAIAQVELMTGLPAPAEAMREALFAAVAARSAR